MMKSKSMYKFLTLSTLFLPLLLLLLLGCVRSHSLNNHPDAAVAQQPILLYQNNVHAEQAKNYQITIPKDIKPGEPCLTISWKTNPDGSGPSAPKIYLVDGYFKIMPSKEHVQP